MRFADYMKRPTWEQVEAMGPEAIDRWLESDPPVAKKHYPGPGDSTLSGQVGSRDYGLRQAIVYPRGRWIPPRDGQS